MWILFLPLAWAHPTPDLHASFGGLEVVVLSDPTASDIASVMVVPVGKADEAVGEEGLSHLTEHAWFQSRRDGATVFASLEAGRARRGRDLGRRRPPGVGAGAAGRRGAHRRGAPGRSTTRPAEAGSGAQLVAPSRTHDRVDAARQRAGRRRHPRPPGDRDRRVAELRGWRGGLATDARRPRRSTHVCGVARGPAPIAPGDPRLPRAWCTGASCSPAPRM